MCGACRAGLCYLERLVFQGVESVGKDDDVSRVVANEELPSCAAPLNRRNGPAALRQSLEVFETKVRPVPHSQFSRVGPSEQPLARGKPLEPRARRAGAIQEGAGEMRRRRRSQRVRGQTRRMQWQKLRHKPDKKKARPQPKQERKERGRHGARRREKEEEGAGATRKRRTRKD